MSSLEQNIDLQDKEKIKEAGIDLEKEKNTYFIIDNQSDIKNTFSHPHLILLPIQKALELYPEIKEKYYWKLVSPEKDDFTRLAYNTLDGGYFIYVKKGYKDVLPLQACFYIKESYYKQKVHNLIILEEDAELHIINGCLSSHRADKGQHIGVTEIFIGKNAFLSYTMVHNWNETTEVYPRSAIQVEEGGNFISNYIALKKTKIVQSYPTVYLKKNAKTSLNSIIYAKEGSIYDVGGRAVLQEEGSRAEVNSRSVVSEGGKVIARAHIQALADKTFGHMECSSLLLTKNAHAHAIPELESSSHDVSLSHEAMVGKIAEEEVFYLMSRGLSEKEAISLIVKGFLNIKILGLPDIVTEQIQQTLNLLENSNAL